HLGLAGIIDIASANRVRAALLMGDVSVSDDRTTSAAGALGGRFGSVVAIGTGSFVARSTASGTQFAGGWGFSLGDQASGAWLGQQLLTTVLLMRDGVVPESALGRTVLADFGDNPAEMLWFSKTATPADYARYAPAVVQAASGGDVTATKLMQEGARYIEGALGAVGHKPHDPLCLIGGVGPYYVPYLNEDIAGKLTEPRGSALDGALRLAVAGYRAKRAAGT
ncbi:MAG: BadF/BadG/BcrA/BcrD ATPase family protein, partial [Halocynthiibacter sp.]